jgi:hypothetical protein
LPGAAKALGRPSIWVVVCVVEVRCNFVVVLKVSDLVLDRFIPNIVGNAANGVERRLIPISPVLPGWLLRKALRKREFGMQRGFLSCRGPAVLQDGLFG